VNILYIEDDANDAALVALYAQAKQHHLVIAAHSRDVPKLLGPDLDLILIDLILDHARVGYDIGRSLRSQGYTQPMIAVTALATAADEAECRSAGFNDVLTKPYTINQLAEVIAQYS
jgi:CheY-like chemotaxis protein